jgi:hypothetical protein
MAPLGGGAPVRMSLCSLPEGHTKSDENPNSYSTGALGDSPWDNENEWTYDHEAIERSRRRYSHLVALRHVPFAPSFLSTLGGNR